MLTSNSATLFTSITDAQATVEKVSLPLLRAKIAELKNKILPLMIQDAKTNEGKKLTIIKNLIIELIVISRKLDLIEGEKSSTPELVYQQQLLKIKNEIQQACKLLPEIIIEPPKSKFVCK